MPMTHFPSVLTCRCKNFYEHGERERLLAENSELRDQVGYIPEFILPSIKRLNSTFM